MGSLRKAATPPAMKSPVARSKKKGWCRANAMTLLSIVSDSSRLCSHRGTETQRKGLLCVSVPPWPTRVRELFQQYEVRSLRGFFLAFLQTQQERAIGNNSVPGPEPANHARPARGIRHHVHLLPSQVTIGLEQVYIVALAFDKYRRGRNRENLRGLTQDQGDTRKHLGLKLVRRVVHKKPHFDRVCRGIKTVADAADSRHETLVRIGHSADLRLLPETHQVQIVLEDVGQDPHGREIGQHE